tara:strand:+ start:44 stop:445 length:402 start_codon:yes stop_codon:yes gene_type:complete
VFLYIGKRRRRLIELAARVAESSENKEYRHGAILVKGNNVLNAASNKNAHARFGKRFRRRDKGDSTYHAELGCVLGLDRSVTRGADLYVVRVGRAGALRLSKPCHMCEAALRHVGIRRVYYSIDENEFGCMKL